MWGGLGSGGAKSGDASPSPIAMERGWGEGWPPPRHLPWDAPIPEKFSRFPKFTVRHPAP